MKFLAVIFLALLSSSVLARSEPIDQCMTGSFYDPEAPGEGINIEVGESYTLVYFYRFDGTWIVLQGDEYGDLQAYQNWGDGVQNVGVGRLVVIDQDTVEFSWDLILDLRFISFERPIPWCLHSDCEGIVIYKRLTQPIDCPAVD